MQVSSSSIVSRIISIRPRGFFALVVYLVDRWSTSSYLHIRIFVRHFTTIILKRPEHKANDRSSLNDDLLASCFTELLWYAWLPCRCMYDAMVTNRYVRIERNLECAWLLTIISLLVSWKCAVRRSGWCCCVFIYWRIADSANNSCWFCFIKIPFRSLAAVAAAAGCRERF